MNDRHNLLSSNKPLRPGDAVSAFIILEDDCLLMQYRDDKPDIFYPGHWGLFGGEVDDGEEPETALKRELFEELRLDSVEITPFISFDFDLTNMGCRKYYRHFYIVRIANADLTGLVLGEGREMRPFEVASLLINERVVPYDAFAIWLHASQHRISPQ